MHKNQEHHYEEFVFTTTARIQYDPHRGGMKKNTKWWCVAHVDPEITRYYRWFIQQKYFLDLLAPPWDAHVSIVRGEAPNMEAIHKWKEYDGEIVPVTYTNYIRQGGDTGVSGKYDFWFVDVQCDLFTKIRSALGLRTGWNHHLTVAKNKHPVDCVICER